MEVIDNFLPFDDFLRIQNAMLGNEFPWYYNDYIAYDPDEKNMFIPPGKSEWNDFQLIHVFYRLNMQYGYQEMCSSYIEPRCHQNQLLRQQLLHIHKFLDHRLVHLFHSFLVFR